MKDNPLLKLQTFGQSVWLDYIRRQMIISGELQQLIEEDGLRGMTSNPAIFEKVIAGSHDYDDDIRAMALKGKSIEDIYQALTVKDVQAAADLFRPVYEASEGQYGFVSLEVNPHLARNAEDTISEARRLWAALDRPNVFIKVPATLEGLPAITELIGQGINVNVTLLFGLPRYRKVAEAYIAGLEKRANKREPLNRVASVASFFLSRIDVLVDPLLEKIIEAGGPKAGIAKSLRGQVAIASAKGAYQIYKEVFSSDRFRELAEREARSQPVLWASTSTKNPEYPDVKYVEPLIGPETVNTLPQETLTAYRDHGEPAPRLEEDLERARKMLESLSELGMDLDKLTQQLEEEGVEKFNRPYDSLMETLEKKRAAALEDRVDSQAFELGDFQSAVFERIADLEKKEFNSRLWRKDPTLWTADSRDREAILNAMGWLHVAEKMEKNVDALSAFLTEIVDAGFRHVVHMGMGGSSLAPLAFQETFAPGKRGLPLTVLDTTDPATILDIEKKVPINETLFIVASKSGTTAEPLAFMEYFYNRMREIKDEGAGKNFVVITDPGTPLADLARKRKFRRTFLNFADIGGRYSALSYFGLLPVALMDLNIRELLGRAVRMTHACGSCVSVKETPGIALGAALGELAKAGRDKVTFLVPEAIATLGMWLEQLLAESTGKEGTGLLPVSGEPVGAPAHYGEDRVFVHIRLKSEIDQQLDRSAAALRKAGQPVITINMEDRMDLCQEFFRWEIATATAGAVLGINPFDQPNVQESKDNTNRLLKVVEEKGHLPVDGPALEEGYLSLFFKDGAKGVLEGLTRFLKQAKQGDYVALLAYLTEDVATGMALEDIRKILQKSLRVATTLGYGPRYLHSTGQYHKGGPNTGLFIQLTADDAKDIQVPGKPFSFGVLKQAQAKGDLEALQKHGRRALRVHLGADVLKGLKELRQHVESGLAGGRS